jgi:dihydropyrimidinase
MEPYDDFVDKFIKLGEERSCIDFSLHLGVSSEEHIKSIPKFCDEYGISSYKFMMAYKGEDAKKAGSAEMTDGIFYDALIAIGEKRGILPCIHAENIELIWNIQKQIKEQGRTDPAAWPDSRPDFTESEFVRRALYLAELTDCPLYIVHTTCKKALEEIKLAREHNSKIFVETCPVYLTHTKEMMKDNLMKVAPPLRSKEDNEALWEGIRDGSIQTVGSDHLALKKESKNGSIWEASMGISGTATVLPALLSEGYHKRNIPLERIAEITSYNVSKIFNLYPRKGNIQIGFDADLTIVDLDLEKAVTPKMLNSASDFSVYDGWTLKGWPISTIVRGNIVMQDGKIAGKKGFGKFIKRKPI